VQRDQDLTSNLTTARRNKRSMDRNGAQANTAVLSKKKEICFVEIQRAAAMGMAMGCLTLPRSARVRSPDPSSLTQRPINVEG
jgi:uracil phosphoribosyltransferase